MIFPRALLCVLLTSEVLSYAAQVNGEDPDATRSAYCATRPVVQCCPGRDDTCTVPFFDTVCYCDLFCNRSSTDCCPDFVGHCVGSENGRPPQPIYHSTTNRPNFRNNCFHEGKLHGINDRIRVNCNNCTCVHAVIKDEYNWKCTQKICLIRPELIQHVNTNATRFGWTATNYSKFWGLTLTEGTRRRLGTHSPTDHITKMSVLSVRTADAPPAQFDARKEWPGLISPVLDQGDCASSWAFSTAGVASDRLRIHSSGAYNRTISPQHLISCHEHHDQHGCKTGHVDRAWWFIRRTGIVTQECFPYKSGKTREPGSCPLPRSYKSLKQASCPEKGVPITVHQATPPYRISPNEATIMREIMQNGPLQVIMEVKEDFFMYRSGVYRHSLPADYLPPDQRQTNFHSVRLIGWGTDNSTGHPLKYWICANSWGTDWGEDGHFRIVRGTDESGVESNVIGAWVKVDERALIHQRHVPASLSASSSRQNDHAT